MAQQQANIIIALIIHWTVKQAPGWVFGAEWKKKTQILQSFESTPI